MGVEHLRDAAEISARALLLRESFGHEAVRQIQAALQVHGLSLRDDASIDPTAFDATSRACELDDEGDLQAELLGLLVRAGLDASSSAELARALGFDGSGGTRDVFEDPSLSILLERAAQRLAAAAPETPMLQRALAAVAELSPCTLPVAARRIHELGLSTAPFAVQGLIAAAELTGVTPRFVFECTHPPIVTTPHRMNVAAEVMVAIARCLDERSVARVEEVVAEIGASSRRDRWFEIVLAVIDAQPDLQWVDRELRMFARAGSFDAIGRLIRKVLAVASQVTSSEIVEVLLNDRDSCGVELPRSAIARICRALPFVELRGDVLTRVAPIDDAVLSTAERAVVDIARARGASVEVEVLVRELAAAGFDEDETQAVLSSPILTKVGRGRYALRGWGFDAESDSQPAAERRRSGAALDLDLAALEREAREAALVQLFGLRPQTTLEQLLAASEHLRFATVVELARAAVRAGVHQTRVLGPNTLPPAQPPASKPVARVGAFDRERYVRDVIETLAHADGGLALEDVRACVGGSQAQVRRVLRQLEDDGRVVRSGSTRWTTYRLS